MESPNKGRGQASPTNIEEESIAFGVMYCPRKRTKRVENLNFDNRLQRQLEQELTTPVNFIEALKGPDCDLEMGFV